MAESKTATVTNGDVPHSTTLRHLLALPAVQEGVRAFSASSVGKISIRLTNSAYDLVGAPVLNLFNKPLAYVIPYAQRADEMGVEALSRVEEKYPVVKKPSAELLNDAKEAAREAAAVPTKHVTEVYNGACKRSGGESNIAKARAVTETAAIVTMESYLFVVRGTLKLGSAFPITQSLTRALDQLEEIIRRQTGADAAGHDQAETPNAAEPKMSTV